MFPRSAGFRCLLLFGFISQQCYSFIAYSNQALAIKVAHGLLEGFFAHLEQHGYLCGIAFVAQVAFASMLFQIL